MTLSRAVIVGASAAGLSAAEGLPAHGYSGEVTLLGEEAGLPYDRPPLSKRFLEGRWEADELALCRGHKCRRCRGAIRACATTRRETR
jgi:3-phenylpropionate/trans-cinnamate dioxygenase ferredoxin reductase subunit